MGAWPEQHPFAMGSALFESTKPWFPLLQQQMHIWFQILAPLQPRGCYRGGLRLKKTPVLKAKSPLNMLPLLVTNISNFLYMHSIVRIKVWLILSQAKFPSASYCSCGWNFWVNAEFHQGLKSVGFGVEAFKQIMFKGNHMWQLCLYCMSGLRP